MNNDHVDTALEQWANERPDIDVSPMAITGRMLRVSAFFQETMLATFKPFDLNMAGFDLLATLLRSGPPYSLSPNELLASSMVTSGTMTNRIDRLVKAGLVNRTQSDEDKRSFSITLTKKGFELINNAVEAHVETLHKLTECLSAKEQKTLITLLRKMSYGFEG